ncbi:hypothetical protein FHX75_12891 [Micromonospora palomenae]|uniref:ATP/GTP-binding protein n=1 Tax=Micromonospora palomenae TaxID=1461247 RepID=A0A561WET2_9ACTN|nr:hypothetical protein [Micromonospora palomenae]TWG22368.1 hypothetical protein FHX75_12891 [Micromonospora palomenae]
MLTWGGGCVPARGPRAGTHRRLLAATLLALLVALAAPVPAVAEGPGPQCPPGQNDCSIWDDDPGTPGDPGGGGDTGGDPGGGAAPKCQWNGKPLPCYNQFLGWFNNADGCYYKLAEPQREAPEGARWYVRTCNGGDLGSQTVVLLDTPPPGFGTPPDPEELARRVLASISLLPPRIAVAPRRNTGPGLVGLPVWMWASPGRNYFGPIHAWDSDRGLRVDITAKVDRIVWTMGNGVKVTCADEGTPYDPKGRRAGKTSPDCGYDSGYPKAGTYRVSATTYWSVTWRGGGESGVIAQTRTSGTTPIEIDELQVVTR